MLAHYDSLPPAMAASAERIATTGDAWDEFAHEIDLVELDLAEASSAASKRAIWADRTTTRPGHHERNLLEAVRVAIAQLRGVV
jgi:hypothetical protein